MKARITNQKVTPGVYQGLNRKNKRKLMKQYHVPMNKMDEVFKPEVLDVKYTKLLDRTKVMLNVDKIKSNYENSEVPPSELFMEFIESNKDKELTIDGSNSSPDAKLYSLVEDTGEPKWKFNLDDLIVLNMDEVVVGDEADENFDEMKKVAE